MTKEQEQTLIEIVLYIINKTSGIDYYRLFKILYFANQRSLVDWGQPMIADKFCALPHGPVPTKLYDFIKSRNSVLSNDISIIDYYLLSKREANLDYISEYDIEVLDECISKYQKMSFSDLKQTSHTNCWEIARKKTGDHSIHPADIARDGGADEDLIKYINENIEFDEAFGN